MYMYVVLIKEWFRRYLYNFLLIPIKLIGKFMFWQNPWEMFQRKSKLCTCVPLGYFKLIQDECSKKH